MTTLRIDGTTVLTALPGREAVRNGLRRPDRGEPHPRVTYVWAVPAGDQAPRTSLVLGSRAGYDKLHQAAADAARAADVVVVLADLIVEGMDRSTLALPADRSELVAANPNTVVVRKTSGAVLMTWLGSVKGALWPPCCSATKSRVVACPRRSPPPIGRAPQDHR